MGIQSLYLCGTTPCPPHQTIKKTSRSTEQHVAWEHVANIDTAIITLKTKGYHIIASELTNLSQNIFETTFSQYPLCLIVGGERDGVSQPVLDHADKIIHIPMMGLNSSMNVATALSIILYEAIRQYKSR